MTEAVQVVNETEGSPHAFLKTKETTARGMLKLEHVLHSLVVTFYW